MAAEFAIREAGNKDVRSWVVAQVLSLLPGTAGIWLLAKKETRVKARVYFDKFILEAADEAQGRHELVLLVLARNSPVNATANVASQVAERSQGSVQVTLLLHSLQDFRSSRGNQAFFFKSCVECGKLLYQNPADRPGREFQKDLAFNFQKSLEFFRARQYTAAGLLRAAVSACEQKDTAICRMLLHNAVSQVLLGLIKARSGYRPNHYALGYLFDLCGLFTTVPRDLFPCTDPESRRLFGILAAHPSSLRHESPDCYELQDMEHLLDRAQKLASGAGKMVSGLRRDSIRN